MATSSKLLCVAYALIALIALIATWSQNLLYFTSFGDLPATFGHFWAQTKVNPASRSITVDIVLFILAAAILMVIEARKHDIKFVWAYIIGGFLVAISVTFPLFLIAREFRMADSEAEKLRTLDAALLALLGAGTAVFVVWIDLL